MTYLLIWQDILLTFLGGDQTLILTSVSPETGDTGEPASLLGERVGVGQHGGGQQGVVTLAQAVRGGDGVTHRAPVHFLIFLCLKRLLLISEYVFLVMNLIFNGSIFRI